MRRKTRASTLRPSRRVRAQMAVFATLATLATGATLVVPRVAAAGPVSTGGAPASVAVDAAGNAILVGDTKIMWTAPRASGLGTDAFR